MIEEAPEVIWLQTGLEDGEETFDTSWEGITWCSDKINDSDVKYIRADLVKKVLKGEL